MKRRDPTSPSVHDPGAWDRTGELELSRDSTAPGLARAWISENFGADIDPGTLSTVKLLVSELVTNALQHGQGAIIIRARLQPGLLHTEVTDEGSGFTWTAPAPDPERTRGFGLFLVSGQSDRWGLNERNAGVWFEVSF